MDAGAGRAAWRGFLFGLGMFGAGVSWVYVSLHNYGNMPAMLAGIAVLLFVAILAGYPALVGWLQARFFKDREFLRLVLIVPALWTLFEWVRSWFLSGFPWLHLGYSQVDSPLSGYAPWVGVYGVSFAVALSAALLAQGWRERGKFWTRYFPVLVVLWAGGWLAGKAEWVRPVDGAIRVALVQSNVALRDKWSPEYRQVIMDRYLDLSARAPEADLIVWPESAIPGYLDEIEPEFMSRLTKMANDRGTDFVLGVVEQDESRQTYYNSAVSVGKVSAIYRKQHLVPFGEYFPMKPLLGWLFNSLHIPMSDFSAGPSNQPPFQVAGQKAGVSICYEDSFGEEIIRMLPEATLLINISEDAWFGNSLAPHQRLQMARMRAIESGRPMVRAANTGPSAVIDHKGTVVARSPQFKEFVLSFQVQPMRGVTPYVRFGNWPIVVVLTGIVILGWFRRRRMGAR